MVGHDAAPWRLGFSPCPNDTFVFHALVHGLVPDAPPMDVVLEDVETLNGLAEAGALDVAKVSFHAFARMSTAWWLLPCGGALGRGVGPLIVARERDVDIATASIATPGGRTTAALLLDLFAPSTARKTVLRYDEIMPAVARGDVDAGLIIHESRFTYQEHGLVQIVDLGTWWESVYGLPLPLGAIAVRRAVGERVARAIGRAIATSVRMAFDDPARTDGYVAEHATEMSAEVRRKHIETYVNDFTLDVGEEGRDAARALFEAGAARGAFDPVDERALLTFD